LSQNELFRKRASFCFLTLSKVTFFAVSLEKISEQFEVNLCEKKQKKEKKGLFCLKAKTGVFRFLTKQVSVGKFGKTRKKQYLGMTVKIEVTRCGCKWLETSYREK
jgi:hypothetical protein